MSYPRDGRSEVKITDFTVDIKVSEVLDFHSTNLISLQYDLAENNTQVFRYTFASGRKRLTASFYYKSTETKPGRIEIGGYRNFADSRTRYHYCLIE